MTPYITAQPSSTMLPALDHQLSHLNYEVEQNDDVQSLAVPRHPLGIKPSGNLYSAITNDRDSIGSFGAFPDELLLQFMELLTAETLLTLGSTCRALYAFSRTEDLWKALFIETPPRDFAWLGTWRNTFLSLPPEKVSQISCRNLFSDVLYRPFQCTHVSLGPYASNIPSQNLVPRFQELSSSDFLANWTDRPFILTDPVKRWPIYRYWSLDRMRSKYSTTAFRAEAVDWPFETYVSYLNNNNDESPLYLFDRGFVEKMGISVDEHGDYDAPPSFSEDFFDLLGEYRPDSRWLIIGPKRSGSTFHKDPNATSAWNAVIRGSKYWITFPPSVATPPGVFVSADQSEVTSPLSIAEWLLTYHAEARLTKGCVEGICNMGEVLHVPSGWWHLVVNLDTAIAITQNFVPRTHLRAALDFLKNKKDQISGFDTSLTDPYGLFVKRLRESYPELLEEALKELETAQGQKKRKWDEVVKLGEEEDDERGGFSFGFGDGDDEDVP